MTRRANDSGVKAPTRRRPLGAGTAQTTAARLGLRTRGAQAKALAQRAESQRLDFVRDRLVGLKGMDPELYEAAEVELKRFFVLVGLEKKPLAMIGPVVDELWHQLVLFTPQYRAFCKKTVGFCEAILFGTSQTASLRA